MRCQQEESVSQFFLWVYQNRQGEFTITDRHQDSVTGSGFFPGIDTGLKDLDRRCALGSWDITGDLDWGVRRHRNQGLQLSYVSRGKVDFCVEDQEHQLRPGDLVVTRPWQHQSVGNAHISACQMYWIILDVGTGSPDPNAWRWPEWFVFSEKDLEAMTAFLCKSNQSVWQAGLDIENCFKKMHQALHIKSDASKETHLRLHINELFVRFHDIQQLSEPSLQSDRATAQQAVDIFLTDLPNQLHMD